MALDDALAVAHLTLGYVSLFQRQQTQVIAETERSLALKPRYAWAHALLAEMLVGVGRPQKAVHLIEKAIELESQSAALFSTSLGFTLCRAVWFPIDRGGHDTATASSALVG